MYKKAGGIFEAISVPVSSSSTEQQPTPDLSPDSAAALSSVAMAQAQELVLKRAMTKVTTKNMIIARLAKKTEELYEKCMQLMKVESVKTLFGSEWVSVVSAKHFMYSGLSELHLSLNCKEAKEIGREIAHLEIAQKMFNKGKEVASAELKAEMIPFLETVDTNLNVAKKDNEFIYFEKVPSPDELEPIEGHQLVQPTTFSGKLLIDEANLFSAMPVYDSSAKKSECIIS